MLQMNTEKPNEKPVGQPRRMSFWQTVASVLSAFFGVQSSKVRQRDFSSGDPLAFIVIAVAMTALFVLILISVVHLILHFAVHS
jgi:hypothetical protein